MELAAGSTRMYHIFRLYAELEACWTVCLFRRCREMRRCCFGPRGTFRRTGGVPLCRTGRIFRCWRDELPDEVRREYASIQAERAERATARADRAAMKVKLDALRARLLRWM